MIIENEGVGISRTDYWQSEFALRDLVYLSVRDKTLRLLLPRPHADAWLAEIKTGEKLVIEPSERTAYPDYFDLVFDDGTERPFVLSIDPYYQIDFPLDNGNYNLIVYAGSLDVTHSMPCLVQIAPQNETPEKYLIHATINTGHWRHTPRSEVSNEAIKILQDWIFSMKKENTHEIMNNYAVRLDWGNSKSAGFTIGRQSESGYMPIIKFAVCIHSRQSQKVWKSLGGKDQPPPAPYLAVSLIEKNIVSEDLLHLPMLADFERCLAWAYLEGEHGE